MNWFICFFFFFQAEDGIRDFHVTGVQTCALPISMPPTAPHLLFVDDEAALRGLMAERLTERGFEVVEADSGERALALLDQFAFDIIITDLRLPGIDGSRLIEAARDRYPGIVAIVITGFGTVKDAVDAGNR